MNRRRALAMLGEAGSLVMASSVVGCGRRRPTLTTRPNVLVAIADDWSWPHAGVAGAGYVRTPHFDRIAREGALFTNAFVSSPSCTPSRAALLTGRYHWELEQGANLWGTLPAKYRTYPDVLSDRGYHVGHCRKGWGPGNVRAGGRAYNPAGPWNVNLRHFFASRPLGSPFCLWFGSHDPHRRYKWGSGEQAGLNPAAIPVPHCLPSSPTVRTDLCDYFGEVERFDRDLGHVLRLLEREGELDNTIVIATSDNGMPFPRCKANCYDLGTHVPLAIRWPEGIRAGTVIDGFVSLCDLAPTILEVAGVGRAPTMSGHSLLGLLGSTGHAGEDRSFVVTGRERHTCAQDFSMEGYPSRAIRTKDFLYIRNFEPDRWPVGTPPAFRDVDRSPTKRYMVEHRTERGVEELFEAAFGRRPAEELYVVRDDPGRLHNVADRLEYRDAKQRLQSTLMQTLRRTGDPRALGEGEVFDSYAYYMIKRIHQ